MNSKNNTENKIEFYFLRRSAERFASDLNHFSKDISSFSDEQLLRIVAYHDYIRENMEKAKKELERRTGNL